MVKIHTTYKTVEMKQVWIEGTNQGGYKNVRRPCVFERFYIEYMINMV